MSIALPSWGSQLQCDSSRDRAGDAAAGGDVLDPRLRPGDRRSRRRGAIARVHAHRRADRRCGRRRRRDAGDRRCQLRAEGHRAVEAGPDARRDHQGDLGKRSRSDSGSLDQAGTPVRGHQPARARPRRSPARKPRRGPAASRASTAPRRATSSPAPRSSRAWSRRSKRRRATCRCG